MLRFYESIVLVLLCVFSTYYAIDFGSIVVPSGHAQPTDVIFGIFFIGILDILCLITIFVLFRKAKPKNIFRIISYSYVGSLALFLLIVKIIKLNHPIDYLEVLYDAEYLGNGTEYGLPLSIKTILWCLFGGAITATILIWRRRLERFFKFLRK